MLFLLTGFLMLVLELNKSSLDDYLPWPCYFAIVMAEDYLYGRFRLLRLALYGLFPILFESLYFRNLKKSSMPRIRRILFHTLDLVAFFAKPVVLYFYQTDIRELLNYSFLP